MARLRVVVAVLGVVVRVLRVGVGVLRMRVRVLRVVVAVLQGRHDTVDQGDELGARVRWGERVDRVVGRAEEAHFRDAIGRFCARRLAIQDLVRDARQSARGAGFDYLRYARGWQSDTHIHGIHGVPRRGTMADYSEVIKRANIKPE